MNRNHYNASQKSLKALKLRAQKLHTGVTIRKYFVYRVEFKMT